MSIHSYLFDFTRVPSFFENWNIKFKVLEMNDTNNFQLVFCDYSSDNISDCLNLDGTINTTNVNIAQTVDCSLKWENEVISIRNNTTWNIGNNKKLLKAVFLRHKNSGYVLGYSININSFDVTNTVTFEADTILWSIIDG